jgi:ankyrin repeat protein
METINAINTNNISTLKKCIVDFNETDSKRRSLLYYAVMNNSLEIAEFLLSGGANPNLPDKYGETPLHLASKNGSLEIVELLVKYNAYTNAFNENDKLPLHYAIMTSNFAMVKALLKSTINNYFTKEFRINLLLHFACRYNSLEIVSYLLENGMDPNSLDSFLETPLFNAIRNNNKDIVKLLLENGTLIEVENRTYSTAIDVCDQIGNDSIKEILVSFQASSSYQEYLQYNILTLSVLNRNYEQLKALILEHRAITKNRVGKSAFDYAKEYNLNVHANLLKSVTV